MPALKIELADFRLRYVGSPNGDAAVTLSNYFQQSVNAQVQAMTNFTYFSSPAGVPTTNLGHIGQIILDGTKRTAGVSTDNLDTITYANGQVLFHTQKDALAIENQVVWSMGAGPHILKGNTVYTDTWAARESSITSARDVNRVALGWTGTRLVLAYRSALTLTLMASYMKSLGCTDAISGDGGGSARMHIRTGTPSFTKYGNDIRPVQAFAAALNYTLIDNQG